MTTVTGLFDSLDSLSGAVAKLRDRLPDDRINVLTPATPQEAVAEIPTTEDMPPVGGALGATLGGALGVGLGLLVPGVGVVNAAGALWATLLGASGGAVGWKVGAEADRRLTSGLPIDELFDYEQALRAGRSVVVVMADDSAETVWARDTLDAAGAEEIDAARKRWWLGLRDAEKEDFEKTDGTTEFDAVEDVYLAGFTAALEVPYRGRKLQDIIPELERRFGSRVHDAAFLRGFERGRNHLATAGASA